MMNDEHDPKNFEMRNDPKNFGWVMRMPKCHEYGPAPAQKNPEYKPSQTRVKLSNLCSTSVSTISKFGNRIFTLRSVLSSFSLEIAEPTEKPTTDRQNNCKILTTKVIHTLGEFKLPLAEGKVTFFAEYRLFFGAVGAATFLTPFLVSEDILFKFSAPKLILLKFKFCFCLLSRGTALFSRCPQRSS